MKKRILIISLITIVAGNLAAATSFAHGGGHPGWGRPGWGHPGWGRPGWGHGPGWGRGGCSPEVKQNVVSLADNVLHEAANSDEFKDATQFKEFIGEAEKIQNNEEKLHAYFSVVGVDSRDADAVVEFIGARNHDVYRGNAEKAMGLTSAQSEILVKKFVTEALSAITQ